MAGVSKKDVKDAMKEVLREEQLTRKMIREMIQEELLTYKEKEELIERSHGAGAALLQFWGNLVKKDVFTIKWYAAQFVLMYGVVLGFMVLLSYPDWLEQYYGTPGSFTVCGLILRILVMVLLYICLVGICYCEIHVYDKIKLLEPKFSKIMFILTLSFWCSCFVPSSSVLDFFANILM